MINEKGSRKKVHGLSWQLVNEKDWMSEHLRSYHYGGDEILIIASGLEDGDFAKKLQIFQSEYAKLNQQLKEPATLSIGYTPARLPMKKSCGS